MAFPVGSILFDMDNTLFDLVTAKIRACGRVTDLLGAGSATDLFSYFLRKQGGFEDPENIRDYMRDHTLDDRDLYAECVVLYQTEKLRQITPYPGVLATLTVLRSEGYPMGIVTDARLPDASLRLGRSGLSRFFDTVVTHEMTGAHKPSTLPFLCARARLNATARETLLVGDSPRRDIAPGVVLGMRTIYARYGDRFSTSGNRGGADHAIDSFPEILTILEAPGSAEGAERQATLF